MSPFLELYEPLDIIGNGSFGIIRKVRRKTDGTILARKELKFEKMTERDRKQIVAEVNILKDLHHDNIVRYHDRYVDRDSGILYILMEYCGGGDLSTIIKQAQKHGRPIPEDTIWNYFLQILLALHHCHHPNGHSRSASGSATVVEPDGKERRPQILHRDLKPDNVFLDEANSVKLGDFGLSKALAQSSFANTYVGTPYYMSPELMQEKAYDSKSDIWSLGCLIYELCALKPPFHEANTHSELSILIRNGRIPPLPRGYSPALSAVIKAMLNLNPAMRPSAAQLLQHERLDLAYKVAETEKMLSTVKSHKSNVLSKEREVLAREAALAEKENRVTALLNQKDTEIASLKNVITELHAQTQQTQQTVQAQVRAAVHKREGELRTAVDRREEEVAAAMARREEEIMEAIRRREEEIAEAWRTREEQIRKEVGEEVDERVRWVIQRTEELSDEEERLENIRKELEEKANTLEAVQVKKTPLEEIKNIMARATQEHSPVAKVNTQMLHTLQTPIARNPKLPKDYMPSAMKGVVLTSTGEPLATPTPAELAHLFDSSPRPGLNFARIFDFHQDDDDDEQPGESEDEGAELSPPPSPSKRERLTQRSVSGSSAGSASSSSSSTTAIGTIPPTRLRRPSIRSSQRAPLKSSTVRQSASDSELVSPTDKAASRQSSSHSQAKPLPHPYLNSTAHASGSNNKVSSGPRTVTLPVSLPPLPTYDLADEENLPSPFLKRIDRERDIVSARPGNGADDRTRSARMKRPSTGNMLRAVAAANAAGRRGGAPAGASASIAGGEDETRPSIATARRASEDARKALSRA
ncbi:hypothetical protein HGRIS_012568 [Hohenbuehelia grisea]|uniref:non-specific serine/threonine protein kinase n=1 Tax=Hohenbuehelia grisea TaxID=104357 RepID=A0ABR3ISN2_9AGAR